MKQRFDPKKTIYLIDGSTFLYRAYYSIRPLHTSQEIPVQAVYGFCRMIKKLINLFDPTKLVLAWDSKGKSERQEIFSEYKAGRQAPPTDLFEQKKLIVKFADLIGLSQVQKDGVEADDIINSLVHDYKDKDFDIVIIASDKDLCQLIDKNVFIYDFFKEELIDENSFETKMGFPVNKLAFYFALLGDSSDNIPGVKGIGKITAIDLVNRFVNLDDLYENIEKVEKERLKKILLEDKDNAFLSYELFKLRYYKIDMPFEELSFDAGKWIEAKTFFQELEFESLLADIEKIYEKYIEQRPFFADEKGYNFKCVSTQEQLIELIQYLEKQESFAIDTETDGLDPLECNFVGLSVCAEKGLAFYIPFGHKNSYPQLLKEEVLKELKPILEDSKYKKYLHNADYDKKVLFNNGIELNGIEFDTLIAASLVLEDGIRLGLKNLSNYFFKERMLDYDDVVKSKKLKNFSYVSLSEATNYAAGDAHQTFALKAILEKKLIEQDLLNVFQDVEMRLSEVLFKMEMHGIEIDINILKDISVRLDDEIKKIEKEIYCLVCCQGEEINLNSPKQLVDLLFNKLKLQPIKKSGKGISYSTDQSVLEQLSQTHIVPKLLLRFRELTKLKTTYVDSLPEYINPKTNRIHTTFSQTTTATGRLASFNPNLQNIPTSSEVRSAFIPKKDNLFLSADYSQIELRILAYFSQDKNLIDAFLNNEDIHTKTTAYLFDVSIDKVTNAQRQIGKRINFSIMYGLTPYGLSKDLKIPMRDAKIYIDKFFAQYPGVQKWMEETINFAKENGYVKTLLGRRRYLPGIHEKNRILYDLARRMAINTPAQGTAADIIKVGMINLEKVFEEKRLGAKILIQIHDELLISVPKEEIEQVKQLTEKVLESVVQWNIPLVVTTRTGNNWQEVTK